MNNSKAEQRMPMPRPANMPPTRNLPPPPEIYDPEVLRFAQQDFNRKRQIQELEEERDELRRHLLDARSEVQRLETRLAREQQEHEEQSKKERSEHDSIVGKLIEARDFWKAEAVRIKTLAQAGAATFLQILDEGGPRRQETTAADKAGLAAVAEELMKEEFPHVVTAGPRDYPSKDELTGGTS